MKVNTLRKIYLEKIVSLFINAHQLSDGNNFYFIDIHGDVKDNCDAIVKICEIIVGGYITGEDVILRGCMPINMKKQIEHLSCSLSGGNKVCFWLEGYKEYFSDRTLVFEFMEKIRKLNYSYVDQCIRSYEDKGVIIEPEFAEILTLKN
jgi:hypothetical protein